MKEYLFFDLASPLMSWGNLAVTKNRTTDRIPTKSAVLGMIAAALGINRSDKERLSQIYKGYQVSVGTVKEGSLMSDFQTTLTVETLLNYGRKPFTRREEIAKTEEPESHFNSHTVIALKEYLEDAQFVVCLTKKTDCVPSLEEVKQALTKPFYPLYLGRRCCIPSVPLNPRVSLSETLEEAFKRDEKGSEIKAIYWEGSRQEFGGPQQIKRRRDMPEARHRDRHSYREVYVSRNRRDQK